MAWVIDEQAAFALARSEGNGVMVHFSATWCVPCIELEVMFGDADVAQALTAAFVPLKLDVSNNTNDDMALRDRYRATALPSVVFVAVDGAVVGRLNEVVDKRDLLDVIERANR